MKTSGYAHPAYAESLAEFGVPRVLPGSGAPLLERGIPGTSYRDARGCYPLLSCRDWTRLRADLDGIGGEPVSLSAVIDPFGEYDAAYLRECFKDVVTPFKSHFVTDLRASAEDIASKHHRYYARKALARVEVEECEDASGLVDEWAGLYGHLARRHGLKGLKAFSRESFARQFEVPGLVVLRARAGGETVGMHLWYVMDRVAYSHLMASSAFGYELMAAYALYWRAIELFDGRVEWLHLGAGAGAGGDGADGLSRFKRGWSTETRTAYFCGRVFDAVTYAELSRRSGAPETGYFPVYRAGEFG